MSVSYGHVSFQILFSSFILYAPSHCMRILSQKMSIFNIKIVTVNMNFQKKRNIEKKFVKNLEKKTKTKNAKCSETSKSGVFFCICTWKVPKNYFKIFGFQRDIEWNCASKHSILAAKKV